MFLGGVIKGQNEQSESVIKIQIFQLQKVHQNYFQHYQLVQRNGEIC